MSGTGQNCTGQRGHLIGAFHNVLPQPMDYDPVLLALLDGQLGDPRRCKQVDHFFVVQLYSSRQEENEGGGTTALTFPSASRSIASSLYGCMSSEVRCSDMDYRCMPLSENTPPCIRA